MIQEGKEDKTVSEVKGKEGRKLAASEEAVTAMENMAQDFAPAVKDFSTGAKLFKDVMETEKLRQLNGD